MAQPAQSNQPTASAPELAAPQDELNPLLRQRLAGWSLKPKQQHNNKYSAVVMALRVVFPVIALGLVAVLFLWPVIRPEQKISLPKFIPEVTMDNPHFSGKDQENRPYRVEADEARQVADKLSLIDLKQPKGEIALAADQKASGRADIGRYDQDQRRLWLAGGVVANNGKGTELATTELMLDLPSRTAWTAKPAKLSGDFGTVEGSGMQAFDGGKVVIFHGPARAVLNAGKGTP